MEHYSNGKGQTMVTRHIVSSTARNRKVCQITFGFSTICCSNASVTDSYNIKSSHIPFRQYQSPFSASHFIYYIIKWIWTSKIGQRIKRHPHNAQVNNFFNEMKLINVHEFTIMINLNTSLIRAFMINLNIRVYL